MPFPTDSEELEREIRESEEVVKLYQGSDVEARTERGDALWVIGECLYQLSRFDEAEQRLLEAAETWDGVPGREGLLVQAKFTRGAALGGLLRFDEALGSFTEAIADFQRDPRLWEDPEEKSRVLTGFRLRVNLLVHLGRPEEASAAADDAIGPDPTEEEAAIISELEAIKPFVRRSD